MKKSYKINYSNSKTSRSKSKQQNMKTLTNSSSFISNSLPTITKYSSLPIPKLQLLIIKAKIWEQFNKLWMSMKISNSNSCYIKKYRLRMMKSSLEASSIINSQLLDSRTRLLLIISISSIWMSKMLS